MRASWWWTALVLLLLAGGSYLLYVWLQTPPLPPQLMYANGRVEATEIRVAAEVPGRVVESAVREGAVVESGDLLVRIDDSDIRLQIARARAELSALGQEKARTREELAVATHHLENARADLARSRELRQQGTVSPRQLEQAENAYREAEGQVSVLKTAVNAMASRSEAAQRELELLQNRLGKTAVRAPRKAVVAVKAVEAGEFVQPGQPVAVLMNLQQVEVEVFVAERNIGKITLGAPVRIRVDAFPERLFPARVARVDQQAQFTPRDIHMPEERVRLVFGVTLEVKNPERILKTGMPADAWILWDPDADWPDRLFVPQ